MKKIILLILQAIITVKWGHAGGGVPVLQVFVEIDSVSCHGGNDGAIRLLVSGGMPPQTSTKGLLISEFHADPIGNDSPFEFVELIATKDIDFSVTPYTIIFVNNGVASANGWIAGGSRTYAFAITSGTVTTGSVVYVGGSSMLPTNGRLRVIDTGNTPGDGGIGNPTTAGVLGNDGSNADAIGVFDVPVGSITSSTVPIDAIFFGNAVGQALVSGGTAGYQLPVNDHYSGGKLQANSFLAPAPTMGTFIKASGRYNVQTNTFTVPRTWVITNTFTELSSSVTLEGAYTFQWSTGDTTSALTGLSSGWYHYTVTDGSGLNTHTNYQLVPQPDQLQYDPQEIVHVSCYGSTDGSLGEHAIGGTPPYTFSSSAGSMNHLPAGHYQITVTDSKGCVSTPYSIEITQPDSLSFEVITQDVRCYGFNDGSAQIHHIMGGVGGYQSSFTVITGNIGQQSGNGYAQFVTAGDYIATVIDNNGCERSEPFSIAQPDPISIAAQVTPCSSASTADGSISLMVAGGTPSYTITWDNGSFGQHISNLTPGTYCALVSDLNGCEVDTCVTVQFTVHTPELSETSFRAYVAGSELIICSIQPDRERVCEIALYSPIGSKGLWRACANLLVENIAINLAGFSTGIYYLEIWTDRGNRYVKKTYIP